MSDVNMQAYENVKDQIGFCGIWCGSCVVGNGTLRELTRKYDETIQAYGLREWAPKDLDFEAFSQGLSSIQGIPMCSGCIQGGGRDDCEMRACASHKGCDDCTQCIEFGACEHLEILDKMRTGALAAGLFVKSGEGDRQEFVRKWTRELERRWPCCVLFMDRP